MTSALQTGHIRIDPRDMICLVGAGISNDAPAGVPLGGQLIEAVCRWLAEGHEDTKQALLSRFTAQPDNSYDLVRFEQLWQTLDQIQPGVAHVMSCLDALSEPNANHLLMAWVLREGGSVLTTNFDRLIERAGLHVDGYDAVPWVPNDPGTPALSKARYLKLHGSFPEDYAPLAPEDYPILGASLNVISQYGYSFEKTAALHETISTLSKAKTFIIGGYSFSDHFDVVPLIEQYASPDQVIVHRFQTTADSGLTEIQVDPIGKVPTHDWQATCLGRIKSKKPDCTFYEYRGPEFSTIFDHLGWPDKVESAKLFALETAENLKPLPDIYSEFRIDLDDLAWSSDQKSVAVDLILGMDGFGRESSLIDPTGSDVEAPNTFEAFEFATHLRNGDVALAKQALQTEVAYLGTIDTKMAHAWLAQAQGDFAKSFKIHLDIACDGMPVDVAVGDPDKAALLSSVAESSGQDALQSGDDVLLARCIDLLDQIATSSGLIWAAFEARQLKVRKAAKSVDHKFSADFERTLQASANIFEMWSRTGRISKVVEAAIPLQQLTAYAATDPQRTKALAFLNDLLAFLPLTLSQSRLPLQTLLMNLILVEFSAEGIEAGTDLIRRLIPHIDRTDRTDVTLYFAVNGLRKLMIAAPEEFPAKAERLRHRLNSRGIGDDFVDLRASIEATIASIGKAKRDRK